MRKNPAHQGDIRQEAIQILYLLRRLISKITDLVKDFIISFV